jgi:hypothetical protein
LIAKALKVLQNKIMLHNERYENFDRKDSRIYPNFKNYIWAVVKERDVMAILRCSKRTAHDYLAVVEKEQQSEYCRNWNGY